MPSTPVSVVTGLVSDQHLEPLDRRRCASSCYYVAPTRNLRPWPFGHDGGSKTKIRGERVRPRANSRSVYSLIVRELDRSRKWMDFCEILVGFLNAKGALGSGVVKKPVLGLLGVL